MDSKRVISLLLAGQMLSAPMAQATSLSLLDKAQRERQGRGSIVSTNAPSPGGRLVIPSAALTADPEDSTGDVVATPAVSTSPTVSPLPPTTAPTTDTPRPSASGSEVTTATPTPDFDEGMEFPTVTSEVTTSTPGPIGTETPPPVPSADVTTPTPTPSETVSPPPAPTTDVTTPTPTPTQPVTGETPPPTEDVTTSTSAPTETGGAEAPVPSETAPVESPVPTETQEVQPSPTASPGMGETDVNMPTLPPAGTVELPEQLLYAQPRAEDDTTAFKKAYVGYGYEIYRAGMPGLNGEPRLSDGRFSYLDENGKEHLDPAAFAVEKDPDAGELSLDGYPYMAYTAGPLFEPEYAAAGDPILRTRKGWGTKGPYQISDIYIGTEYKSLRYTAKSLEEIQAWLGRIPDYKFTHWAVSGWGPPPLSPYADRIWPYVGTPQGGAYGNGELNVVQTLGDGTGTKSSMVPVLYGDWEGHPDLPLVGTLDDDVLCQLRETVVEFSDYAKLSETFRDAMIAADKSSYYAQYQYAVWYGVYTGNDPGRHKEERELPIIAHWTLSDDASLMSTQSDGVGVNALEEADRTKVYNGIYTVKATDTDTDDNDTRTNLLDSLYSSRADLGSSKTVTLDTEAGGTYYIRVNSDVVGMTPEFITTEAFRALQHADDAVEELGEGAGVDISFRPAGSDVTTNFARGGEDTVVLQTILNDRVDKDGKRYLLNNDQYPMRSMWTLGDVTVEDGDDSTEDVTTSYVPLTLTQPVEADATEADILQNYFNELTVTVTPPSGNGDSSKVKTFTFYIQRLSDPKLFQNPGNTPRGMLVRDDPVVGGWNHPVSWAGGDALSVEEYKELSWDIFLNPRKYFEKPFLPYSFHGKQDNIYGGRTPVPQDDVENNKGFYDVEKIYWPNAWNDNANPFTTQTGGSTVRENLDLNEEAIVVYLDSSFVDPGFTLYDSQNERVVLVDKTGRVNPNVTRSVVLNVASGTLTPENMASDASNPEQSFYSGGGEQVDSERREFQVVRRADGRDQIDLRGAKVVPGIYTIEYRYTDPLSGWEYTSENVENFLDDQLPADFRRPLVILPIPGDVDMDGALTSADSYALEEALKAKASGTGFLADNDILNLFMYRVCDINNDGVVDDKDVAKLRGYRDASVEGDLHGVHHKFERNNACEVYYYIPLWSDLPDAGLPEIETTWRTRQKTTLDNINTHPVLSLEYLGVHESQFTDGDKLSQIKNEDENGETIGVDANDIFWVGIKVSDLARLSSQDALAQGISDITLSLAYNSRDVEPTSLRTGTLRESDWRDMLKNYNVQAPGSANTGDKYLWPAGYEIVADGSWSSSGYFIDSSKAIIDGETEWNDIRQMTIMLHAGDGAELRQLSANDEGYLFRIPFKLKWRNLEEKNKKSIDLVLGMKDFILRAGGNWYAWDASDEGIFNATTNLADQLTYNNTLAFSTGRNIPLTSETSLTVVKIKNNLNEKGAFVYGEGAEVRLRGSDGGYVWPSTDGELKRIQALLPKGLTITENGTIRGTVEDTMDGEDIRFSVDVHPYVFQFNVEKAPLKVTAVGQEIYYGEKYAELSYLYDAEMIRDVDKPGGANYIAGFTNNGKGEELKKLTGYTAPKLSANMEQGDDAGEYAIAITNAGDSGLGNYYFIYVKGEFDKKTGETKFTAKEDVTSATTPLFVDKRPIRVNELTNTVMSVSFHVNEVQDTRKGVEATYQSGGANEFSLIDLTQEAAYAGLTGEAIYGDDKVTLTFTAKVKHDQENPSLPYFDLEGKPSGTRPITISELKLKEETTEGDKAEENSNRNYVLLPGSPKNDKATATITDNPIVKIEVRAKAPDPGPYEYGQSIDFLGMKVRFMYARPIFSFDPDSIYSTEYEFSNDTGYSNLGIHITYETLEDIQSGNIHWNDKDYSLIDDKYMSKPLATDVHNGKYVCISVKGQIKGADGKDQPGMVIWHSEKPLVVTKKAVELTAGDALVYYGEYQPGMLDTHFTYNVAKLDPADREIIKSKTGKEPTGASEELAYLTDYVAPVITVMSGDYNDSTPVTQGSPVRWDETKGVPIGYNIYITDAKDEDGNIISGTSNYSFRYTKAGVVAKDGIGTAALTILPRPVYVEQVTLGEYTKTYLYDDTTVTTLETMTDEKGVSQKVTASGLNAAVTGGDSAEDNARANADTFIAKLPGAQFYERNAYTPVATDVYNGEKVMSGTGKAGDPVLTGEAIYTNDSVLDQLKLTYQAVYPVDNPQAAPPDDTFFDLNGALEKLVTTNLRNIALPRSNTGANANGNYHLVYKDQAPAISGGQPVMPTAQGRIILRPLASMSIVSGPTKVDYTYGQEMNLSGMSLRLKLESIGDNAPESNRNVISRTERYRDYNNGQNSFSEQGLKVCWMTDELAAMSEAELKAFLATPGNIDKLEEAAQGSYPDVSKAGKKLLVVGRRSDAAGAEDAGHILTFAVADAWSLTVKKKTLPLTVEGIDRYYGEPNGDFRAYYTFGALAQPDQTKLLKSDSTLKSDSKLYLSAERDDDASVDRTSTTTVPKDVSTTATSDELTQLNSVVPDLAVRFVTKGTQGSDVGQYTIELEMLKGRNLDNYEFTAASSTAGKLRVFRRPIEIAKVYEDPVFSIYNNTVECEFPTSLDQTGQMKTTVEKKGFMTQLPVSNGAYISDDPEVLSADVKRTMTLSGDAIYSVGSSQDKLGLTMTVVFKPVADRAKFEGDNARKYLIPDDVEIKSIALTGSKTEGYGSGNYWLVFSDADQKQYGWPTDKTATGQLDRRPIEAIRVEAMPRMEYTYGENLNLNSLAVWIKYKQLEDYNDLDQKYDLEQILSYQNLAGRLTVNYWDSPTPPAAPITDPSHPDYSASQAAYRENVSYCLAANGDHLTIMPSHEEKFRDKNGELIGHDGKYLLLTARENESMMYEAPAVLVCDPKAADGTPEQSAVALKVNKLDLTYALTADDRTYNDPAYAEKTSAAGTITLKNVYTYSATDRDLVYVSTDVTDSAYGDYATDAAVLQRLKDDLNDSGKSTYDTYTFAARGDAMSTGLTFTFYDENVAYFDEVYTADERVSPEDWYSYWTGADHSVKQPSDTGKWDVYGEIAPMPVLASNIRLMGPDAGNYTLDAWVGKKDDVAARPDSATADDPDKDQTPYARINKADQAIDLDSFSTLPTVSVDAHSNVVKLTYDADGVNLADIRASHGGDQYEGELHYEYGLQYIGRNAGDGEAAVMTQWGDWSDYIYFGGEKMEAKNDPGYTDTEPPKEPEEDDVVKGQLYPWAEDDKNFGAREPLDRNKVYWGMVKLSETHNYNESAPVFAYNIDDADPTVAPDEIARQKEEAQAAASALSELVLSWVQNKPEEDDPEPELGPAPAVKTYTQSFKVLSTEEKPGKSAAERYNIDTLEAVWFTDIQQYAEARELSAVLRNVVKTRYYDFFWDQKMKAKVEMSQSAPLDLSKKPLMVKMDVGGAATEVEVNIGDDPEHPRDDSAVIYVSLAGGGSSSLPTGIGFGGGGGESGASMGGLTFTLGSDPVKLKLEVKPQAAMLEGLTWTSTDSNVVMVDADGWLHFVGVGVAEITVTTRRTKRTATITITVTDPEGVRQGVGIGSEAALKLAGREDNHFDFYHTRAFFALDGDYCFYPENAMTRAELVKVLARFYLPEREWVWDGSFSFSDMTQWEDYTEPAELLREMGILTGLPGGLFGAEQTATRAEVAAILCRMMGLPPEKRSDQEHFFLDYGQHNGWADGYIDALARAGVVNGTGDGIFAPDRAITRAELAAMLSRVLLTGVYYGDAPIIPSDVTETHWAYGSILRAVNTVVFKTVPVKKD